MLNAQSLEPLKYYNDVLAPKHRLIIETLWKRMTAASRVDIKQNKIDADAYRVEQDKSCDLKKRIGRLKSWRKAIGCSIWIAAVVALVMCVVVYLARDTGDPRRLYLYALASLGALAATCGAFFLFKKWKDPEIERLQNESTATDSKAQELLQKCLDSMAALNSTFDERQAWESINQACPEIKIEPYLSEKWNAFVEDAYYDYLSNDEPETQSILGCLNGTAKGSPFIVARWLKQGFYNKTYTGYRTIRWKTTESSYDFESKKTVWKEVEHSQTLSASVTKPAPFYQTEHRLFFFNDVLPNLHFGRSPEHVEKLDEGELKRFIKEKEKEMKKMAEKAVKSGGGYTPLTNREFAALFHAFDRSDEHDFRVMFTPLAETNMTDLMLNSPYGDDFQFIKSDGVTLVQADHCVDWNLRVDPKTLVDYDYENAKLKFTQAHDDYFKRLYFLLAPCFAIPCYAEGKPPCPPPAESEKDGDCSEFLAESMANVLINEYAPSGAATQTILNVKRVGSKENSAVFAVDAYSFSAENRVESVSVYGDDGHYHNVDVEWVKYNPIRQKGALYVKKTNTRETEYLVKNGTCSYAFRSGLVAGAVEPNC